MLKKIINLLLCVVALQTAVAQTKVKGITEEKDLTGKIYISQYFNHYLVLVDSAEIKKGKFKFSQQFPTGMYELGYKNTSLPVILEGEEIIFSLKLSPTLRLNAIKDGSQATIEYDLYRGHNQSFDQQAQALNTSATQIASLRQTNPQAYNTQITNLRQSWDSLQLAHNKYIHLLAEKVKSPFLKDVCKLLALDENNKDKYLQAADFKDERFTRGTFLSRKINTYFLQVSQLNSSNLIPEMDGLLILAPKQSKNREVVYETAIATIANFDMTTAKQYARQYLNEYPKSIYAKAWMSKFPVDIGDPIKEISALSPDRKTSYKLSELKGKVVLLDFWASWCGPCIREMPNVVAAYNKYHNKGFEIFSVSLDTDVSRWKTAIDRFNMTWPYHVSQLNKWQSTAARDYGVRGIPFMLLIDENGTIVAKNLRGQELEKSLAKIFEGK